jgi:hypothetical protein
MVAINFHFKARRVFVEVKPAGEGRWNWFYTIDDGPVREGRPVIGIAEDAAAEAMDTAKREIALILGTGFVDLDDAP